MTSNTVDHKLRILFREDDLQDRELVARALASDGLACDFTFATTEKEFRAALARLDLDLVLCDCSAPSFNGHAELAAARDLRPDTPIVLICGCPGDHRAVDLLDAGATDFVRKNALTRLPQVVRRALRETDQRRGQRRAEAELRTSEQRLRILFEFAPDAYYLHDLKGLIVDGNKAAEAMLGYSREELIGKNLLQISLLAPEDIPRAAEAIAQNAQGLPTGPLEFTLRRKDGAQLVVETRAYPVLIQDQVFVLGLARDITERKRSSQNVETSQRLLKATLDNIPDPVWFKDTAGRYLADNEAHAGFFGRKPHELLGKTFSELMPHQASVTNEEDARVLATGQPSFVEERLTDAAGKVRWFETSKSPVFDAQGKILGTVGVAREITERMRSHQELKASEQRFRSVWENSIDGMRLLDRAGRIIAVNDAYCRLVKMPRERLVGQLFSVVYKDQGAGDSMEVYRHRFDTGTIIPRLQAKVTLWNLQEFELDISSSFIEMGERGKLVFSIFRDITESRAAELRSAAFSRLAQLLSAARTAREAAEVIVDVADQLLGWDSCWFGLYSPAEDKLHHVLNRDTINGLRSDVEPTPHTDYLTPVARHTLLFGGQLILKGNPNLMLTDSLPFGDTNRPSASLLFVPVRNGAEVVGILSIQSYTPKAYDQRSLDTLQALADHCGASLDRIRAQEKLLATQQRFTHLLEESPAVIYSLKIDGQNLVPMWLSGNVQQLVGFSVEEASHPDWWRLNLHPDHQSLAADTLPALLRFKQTTRDYRLRHKNGDYRWIRDEQRLISGPNGQPVEIVGSWVDITERKALEDLLRQSQKLEAIGLLAGGVAHDFNNLIAVMRGNADLLLMDARQYSGETREALAQITTAAGRAATLTRQLLAFGRKQVMQSQPLLLNDVVANLTNMLKRVIGEHIELQCQYDPALAFVQADVGMMEQVLLNLVLNARDAMPQGGQLFISTEKARIDEAAARANPEARVGEFVCLTVRDTGAGIAPENLPRIFEPFFTTKQPGKGTGLGLATAYGIIKQHQGWLQVASTPGQGATFKFFLPASTAPAAAPAYQTERLPRGGPETILLVEDEFAVRVITRRVLETVGYKVHEACQAREARDLWARSGDRISLLLTDIMMPEGTSGLELADQLRAQRAELKVIFMSGYTPDVAGQDTAFFRRSGNFFIQKPFASKALLEAVRSVLDEKR
jgi:PAS domain S-box-containing protein